MAAPIGRGRSVTTRPDLGASADRDTDLPRGARAIPRCRGGPPPQILAAYALASGERASPGCKDVWWRDRPTPIRQRPGPPSPLVREHRPRASQTGAGIGLWLVPGIGAPH